MTHASYDLAVRERLDALAARPNATLEGIAGEMRGVFPTETLSQVQAYHPELLGRRNGGAQLSSSLRAGPELHPLDYEWYFVHETSQFIASGFEPVIGPIACLGAPTVAAAIAKRRKSAILVDSNPLAITRITTTPFIHWIQQDLRSELQLQGSVLGVFFDAPWYPEYVLQWLLQAVRIAAPGSTISFSLFPELTRPSAGAERAELLALAEQFGPVEVRKDALRYETPLFELEVLRRHGLERLRAWRSSDLVKLSFVNKAAVNAEFVEPAEHDWEAFLIGAQVVKLRKTKGDARDWLISPLTAYPDFVATSVSRRDPNRPAIDVWTSRNRVARVGNRATLALTLQRLEAGDSFEVSLRAAVGELPSIDLCAERKLLKSFLGLNSRGP